MDPLEIVKSLLDVRRLAVAGALASAPADVAELGARTGLSRRDVLDAVGTLRTVGLVAVDGDRYRLDEHGLRHVAQRLATTALPMDPFIGYGMSDDEQVILSRFFEGRRLIEIPTSRPKRLVVLERLALEFEVGRHYPESEVNAILGTFHPDWSALRRYLVDEGFLDRADNHYWRSGGKVPIDAR